MARLNERSQTLISMQQRMESRMRRQQGRLFGPSPHGGPKNCPTIVLAHSDEQRAAAGGRAPFGDRAQLGWCRDAVLRGSPRLDPHPADPRLARRHPWGRATRDLRTCRRQVERPRLLAL